MPTSQQAPDGRWVPAVPLPLYVGWRLRKLRCECGRTFGKGSYAERVFEYETHWREAHAGEHPDAH